MDVIDHRKLWKAEWRSLCRLGRSLGLTIRPGLEGHRRGPVVEAIKRRLGELKLQDAAARKKYDRRLYPVFQPGTFD
jgi:hypothetical protein